MAVNGLKLLKIAGNFWKWLEMAEYGWEWQTGGKWPTGRKWLKISYYGWQWLEKVGNG